MVFEIYHTFAVHSIIDQEDIKENCNPFALLVAVILLLLFLFLKAHDDKI